jgi:hypothetical protein
MEAAMSWEQMWTETKACPCGKGTISYSMDSDDWNRSRHYQAIHCPQCKAEADEKSRREKEQRETREALLAKALKIAQKRYLAPWLALYADLNKKAAWQLYTGGSGYPALGTFYKHIKFDGGIEQYLRRSFSHDFQRALKQMNIKDGEIEQLLTARAKIPEPRSETGY